MNLCLNRRQHGCVVLGRVVLEGSVFIPDFGPYCLEFACSLGSHDPHMFCTTLLYKKKNVKTKHKILFVCFFINGMIQNLSFHWAFCRGHCQKWRGGRWTMLFCCGMKEPWRRCSQPTVQGHARVVLSAWERERKRQSDWRRQQNLNDCPPTPSHTLCVTHSPTQTLLTEQTLWLTRHGQRHWENEAIVYVFVRLLFFSLAGLSHQCSLCIRYQSKILDLDSPYNNQIILVCIRWWYKNILQLITCSGG